MDNKKTYTYAGWLSLGGWPRGEDDGCEECVFLSDSDEPLFDRIQDEAHPNGRTVFVRWWWADKEASREELSTEFTMSVLGASKLCFGARYSEATGYLWTDNEFIVGGHDLNTELGSLQGKWVHFELDVLDKSASRESKEQSK
jgi:hypothetical protein